MRFMEDMHVYLNKLSGELRLRKYSKQTEKAYLSIIGNFVESGLQTREFLLRYTEKSRSSIRSAYFALKFFHENVLRQKLDEKIPLAKSKSKLPVVLNKDEVNTDFNFNDFIKNSVTEINGKTGLKESGEPAVAKKEDDGDDDDSSNEVVPAPKATMKCSEIWDRITAHPRYTEIDIDGLCNEMKNKAKCSEKGVVINADDVSLLLERSIRR